MMALTSEELKIILMDPNRVKEKIFDDLEAVTNGDVVIVDPTNPFVSLVECMAIQGGNTLTSMVPYFRKLYPSLAINKDDLKHHITMEESINLETTPAETSMVIYLNVTDLRSNGIRSPDFVETILPIGTSINVNAIWFTLLNSIIVRIYDNGTVYAEQAPNDNPVAINSLGVLRSGVDTFVDGEAWLFLETLVKQVRMHTVNKNIVLGDVYDKTLIINNKYYHSELTYSNEFTYFKPKTLNQNFDSGYLSPETPTTLVTVTGNEINFVIPDIYILNGMVSGDTTITLYETLGVIDQPIHRYKMSEYSVNLPTTGLTETESTIANITLHAISRQSVTGGNDGLSFEELRKSIINHTMGNVDVPITDNDINKLGSFDGFRISKRIESITNRLYSAFKDLPEIQTNMVQIRPDIIFDTLTITLADLPATNNIIVREDTIVIKSNTLIRNLNGVLVVVSDADISLLEDLDLPGKLAKVNSGDYYLTRFHTILSKGETSNIFSRVYDFDNPKINNIKISGRNINVTPRVNTELMGIAIKDYGYLIRVTLISNPEFDNTDRTKVVGQLTIGVANTNESVSYPGTYNVVDNVLEFKIITDLQLTSAGTLTLLDGISAVSNTNINIFTDMEIYIITRDVSVVDSSDFLKSDIVTVVGGFTVLNKETLSVSLGVELKYIATDLYNTFTENKYVTHTTDIPLRYSDDVYDVDPVTGSILRTSVDISGNTIVSSKLLHAAGDVMLDETGTPLYANRIGDVKLDDSGTPIIDLSGGVSRNVCVMLKEYCYSVPRSTLWLNYEKSVSDTILSWLTIDLPKLNSRLLENTKVNLYACRNTQLTKVNDGGEIRHLGFLSPVVRLYTKADFTKSKIDILKNAIVKVLLNNLDSDTIFLNKIENDIVKLNTIDILSCDVSGIGNGGVISLSDKNDRLSIKKSLTLDDNNDVTVVADVTVIVHKI